jgi:hypothetical protein
MPISARKKLMLSVCAVWIAAPSPSLAGDQETRFLELPNDADTLTYDLSTVQMIQPGRFTVIGTTIDNPDVMKLELKLLDSLRTYCKRPDGKYPAPADLLTLGQPDMPIETIEVDWQGKLVSWSYPYKRLQGKVIHMACSAPDLYRKGITNGFWMKALFDCRRGLIGSFLNEDDDPSKAFHASFVKQATRGEWYYRRVCYAVMHELPYEPE